MKWSSGLNLVRRFGQTARYRWLFGLIGRHLFLRKAFLPFARGYVTIREEHFRELASRKAQQQLFKRSVETVEIEVFTYCNRKCWFCPNVDFDRRSTNTLMSELLYQKLLDELAQIDYGGKIFYSRYNEPFADRVILDRLRTARHTLPNATLCTFTNGDYLNPEYLEEIYDAGLREIYVSLYLGNNAKFEDARMRRRIEHFVDKLGLQGAWSIEQPGIEYHYRVKYRDMQFVVFGRNFDEIGYDRAGTVELSNARQRSKPCLVPFTAVYIDANGTVVPCCNVRSDVPAHEQYLVGDINKQSVYDIYARHLAGWRKELIRFGSKKAPCDTCLMHEEKIVSSPANRAVSERIYREFVVRKG